MIERQCLWCGDTFLAAQDNYVCCCYGHFKLYREKREREIKAYHARLVAYAQRLNDELDADMNYLVDRDEV